MNNAGTILVVDDTLGSLKMMVDILQAEGYQVRPANSGELALSAMASQTPDLVLLDIRMPGIDGFEVCRRIKADHRTCGIPVIFLSAEADQKERLEGFGIGAVDFVSKPFQREELLARIGTHLELWRLRQHLEAEVARRTAELAQRNQELQLASERLRLATQAAKIGIWDWNIVKDELVWDDSMYALYGIRREDFWGAYDAWTRTLHPEDKARTEGEIHAALRGEREFAPEFRVIWPDGSIHHIKAESQTFRDKDGKALRMIGTNIDVTHNREAQAKNLAQLEELRQWYAATINREKRMEELKNEVNQLLVRLGAAPKYQGGAVPKGNGKGVNPTKENIP